MPVWRIVTAPDEATAQAKAQVNPGVAQRQAGRAAMWGLGLHVGDLVQVGAFSHDATL
jgi:hypothetical protein